ncbi:hypothetical protein P261_02802 [Lachnospiraceae bacterium TWA4]|nr:hypothetical protein P261_02802 [Lachnospiraceae bacterium TWA4]
MSNYSKTNIGDGRRTELHDILGLTGAEISVNNLQAGEGVPFFHSHKQNEEIYIVFKGKGVAIIDDETFDLVPGDVIRVAPEAKRKFSASQDVGVSYICIQVKENSIEQFTDADGVLVE